MAVQIKSSLATPPPPLVLPIFLCCRIDQPFTGGLLRVWDEFGYSEYYTTGTTIGGDGELTPWSFRIYENSIQSYPMIYRNSYALSEDLIKQARNQSKSRDYGVTKTILDDSSGVKDNQYKFWLCFYAWVVPGKKYRVETNVVDTQTYEFVTDDPLIAQPNEIVIDKNENTYMLNVDYYQYAGYVLQYTAEVDTYYVY